MTRQAVQPTRMCAHRCAVLGALLVALAMLVLGTAASRAQAAAPPDFLGMNAQFLFSRPADQWDANLAAMAGDGVRAVRSDSIWAIEEPTPPDAGGHHYDWSKLDAWVGALARHGLRWAPIVDFSVWWDRTVPGNTLSPPAEVSNFAAYSGALASRYGPGGSFWAANGSLAYLPVYSWEIWNEENLPMFWAPAPNPAAYADLYSAARTAIHNAASPATVAVGGLASDSLEGMLGLWLTQRPDSAHHIDAVAFHPYGGTPAYSLSQVQRLRTDLSAMGSGGTPIIITEVGWTTSGNYWAVSDATRADYTGQILDQLARSDCGVVGVFPHTWITNEQDPSNGEDWYGLHHPNGSASASEWAYAAEAGRISSGSVAQGTLHLCGAGGAAATADPLTGSVMPPSGGSHLGPARSKAPTANGKRKSTAARRRRHRAKRHSAGRKRHVRTKGTKSHKRTSRSRRP